jgi:cytochrome c2
MQYKKTITLASLLILVVCLSAFMPGQQTQQDRKATNLKVLPKNISEEELDKVMDGFKVALGVKCNYCHAPNKDNPKKLDFASDAKPEKEIARNMMRMTAKINKKYFHLKEEGKGMLAVSCITCHNGQQEPKSN